MQALHALGFGDSSARSIKELGQVGLQGSDRDGAGSLRLLESGRGFADVQDINERDWIVGTGDTPNTGGPAACLAVPVPEPGAMAPWLAKLGLGLVGAAAQVQARGGAPA